MGHGLCLKHSCPIYAPSGRNRVKLFFFWGGGSLSRRSEDIHKHPPPLDIVRVTSSALRKIEKHPHSWRHLQAPPPPSDIALVTSSTFQGGGGVTGPGHAHFAYRFSVSGQVQGGGSSLSHTHPDPPLLSETKKLGETKAERTTYHHNALLTSKSYYNVS